jgi:hypothetical protein
MKRLLAVLLVAVVVGGCNIIPQRASKVAMPDLKGLEILGSMPVVCPDGTVVVIQGMLDRDHQPGYNAVYVAAAASEEGMELHERPIVVIDFDVVADGEPEPKKAYIDKDEDGYADDVVEREQFYAKYGSDVCSVASSILKK